MTDQRQLDRLLDAFFVEGTDELADRVIDGALDQIDHTRQRRVLRTPRRFSSMNMPSRVAAAAVVGVLAVGGALYLSRPGQVAVTPPSPSAAASSSPDTAVVASPRPSPSLPPSSPPSSLEPCYTDQVQVLSGDASPAIKGDSLSGLGQSRGVYLAGRQPALWAVGPGQSSTTLIATITPQSIPLDVVDISPDGSNALIRVGHISPPGFTPECADLYLIQTDGSAVTRLTTFGSGRFVAGAAFSPDSGRVAFVWWSPDTITVLDLASGQTVDQACVVGYGGYLAPVVWSPSGNKIAADCNHNLTIFDAAGTAAEAKFPTVEDPLAFKWTDDRHLIVATGGANTYTFDVSTQTSTIVGHFPTAAMDIASQTGVFSPDGRWLAYAGAERAFLVPTIGGTPARIPNYEFGRRIWFTWTADSRALVDVTGAESKQGEAQLMVSATSVETLQRSPIGTITNRQPFSLQYGQGVWRIP
jgi:hypothetical protein